MSPEKLVHMANQIAKFFAHEGEQQAVLSISTHLKKFWDPRMRTKIVELLESDRHGMDPLVVKAVESLRR